jgi:hypothetical protein
MTVESSGSRRSWSFGVASISRAVWRARAIEAWIASRYASVPLTTIENQSGRPRARRVRWYA